MNGAFTTFVHMGAKLALQMTIPADTIPAGFKIQTLWSAVENTIK